MCELKGSFWSRSSVFRSIGFQWKYGISGLLLLDLTRYLSKSGLVLLEPEPANSYDIQQRNVLSLLDQLVVGLDLAQVSCQTNSHNTRNILHPS